MKKWTVKKGVIGHNLIIDENGDTIASTWAKTVSEREESARLMAASPDLMEALRFYVLICGNTAYSTTRESAMEAYEMANKAIAKAEGRAQ